MAYASSRNMGTFMACFAFALLCACPLATGQNKTVINILHMWTKHITGRAYSPGRETVDYAIKLVNERDDILPGYTVEVRYVDVEQFNVGKAVKAFIDAVSQPPTFLAIIGPRFSSQTEILAETAGFFNLVEISFTATSPSLSNTDKYPLLARTSDSTALNNLAIVRIIKHFDWSKVATITYDTEFAVWSKNHITNLLVDKNVSIIEAATYSTQTISQTKQLKESKARIILSYSYFRKGIDSKRLLCEVYKDGVFGKKYQWLHWKLDFGFMAEIDAQDDVSDGCTLQQVLQAAEGTLIINPKPISWRDFTQIIGDHGMTTKVLQDNYHRFLNESGDYPSESLSIDMRYTGFDAAWSLMLGLNDSLKDFADINASTDDFNYERNDMAQILFNNIKKQKFYGASGPISFNENGDKVRELNVFQMRSGEIVLVATYNPFTNQLHWYVDEESLFPGLGGRPPYDEDVIVTTQVTISRGLFLTASVLAVAGIVYSCVSCAFTWRFRHTKYVKMSSPRINALICFGCILTYTAVILWGIDSDKETSSRIICMLRKWFLVCGFTFAFGSMFSKTWRVHKIITTKTLQRKIVRDRQLFIFVLCFLVVDIVLLFLWEIIDPLRREQQLLDIEEDYDEDGKIYQPVMYKCSSKYSSYWSGIFYFIKGLLLIFGIFFAWETRKITIEGLNDSKLIGLCVYSVVTASVLTVPLVNILPVEQYDIIYGITVISMLACSTIATTLVFGVKAYKILLYGERIDEFVQTPFEATHKTIDIATTSRTIPRNTLFPPMSSNAVRPSGDPATLA